MKKEIPEHRRLRKRRTNDPEGNRRNIMDVATREFAEKGFSGARVDAYDARREPASE
jgi:AcrR family transcriptional regulator